MHFGSLAFLIFISGCYSAAALCPCAPPPYPICGNVATQCPYCIPQPCSNTALENFLTNVLYSILTGSCSGVNQMDPLTIDLIQGNFSTLQYTDYNNTVTGLCKTRITSLKISEDNDMTMFTLDIPSFSIKATQNLTGYILYLEANTNGTGNMEIDYGRYSMKVYAQLTQLVGPNNCTYMQFGNFSVDPRAISPVTFNFSSLYDTNGTCVTAERNQFMNDNWEDMAYFVQDPIADPIIQKLLTFANNYLVTVPINSLLCSCS